MTDILRGELGLIDARTLAGYAFDPAQPGRHFVVEILVDGIPVSAVRADAFCPGLAQSGAQLANHGFVCTLSPALIETSHLITARLANLATPVGLPIDLDSRPRRDPLLAAPGAVERVEGRTIAGWIGAPAGTAALVRALIAGEEVAATIARTWTSRLIGGQARPVLAFAIQLPTVLADGERHSVIVTTASGLPLVGSPLIFTSPAEEG